MLLSTLKILQNRRLVPTGYILSSFQGAWLSRVFEERLLNAFFPPSYSKVEYYDFLVSLAYTHSSIYLKKCVLEAKCCSGKYGIWRQNPQASVPTSNNNGQFIHEAWVVLIYKIKVIILLLSSWRILRIKCHNAL